MTQYINLYDPALRRESPLISAGQLGVALALVTAVLVGWATLVGGQVRAMAREAAATDVQLVQQREQLAQVGKALAARKPDVALTAELAATEARLAARGEVIAVLEGGAIGNKNGFSGFLRAFSRQTVHGLWLTGFDISGGGSEMAIRGRALEPSLLPRYIHRLNDEDEFRGRSFATLDMDAASDKSPVADQKSVAPKEAQDGASGTVKSAMHYIEFNLASAKANAALAGAKP